MLRAAEALRVAVPLRAEAALRVAMAQAALRAEEGNAEISPILDQNML